MYFAGRCARGYMTRLKVAPLFQEARAKRKQEAETGSGQGSTAAAAPAPPLRKDEPDGRAESADSRRMKEDMLAKQRRYDRYFH